MLTVRLIVFVSITLLSSCADRFSSPGRPADSSETLTVFAAASTARAVRATADAYESATGTTVVTSIGATSTLARQLAAGAPADVFLAADVHWMDHVEQLGAVDPTSRIDLLSNGLVLIVPTDALDATTMSVDLADSAPPRFIGRLALADPAHVPAGRYARDALESLGWWTALQPHVMTALDVRAALRLVQLGEADAGIVYASDAQGDTSVTVLADLPRSLHEPIVYPIAILTESAMPSEAASFIAFLRSPDGRAIFERSGFEVIDAAPRVPAIGDRHAD